MQLQVSRASSQVARRPTTRFPTRSADRRVSGSTANPWRYLRQTKPAKSTSKSALMSSQYCAIKITLAFRQRERVAYMFLQCVLECWFDIFQELDLDLLDILFADNSSACERGCSSWHISDLKIKTVPLWCSLIQSRQVFGDGKFLDFV